MFLGVDMIDLHVAFWDEASEVVVIDRDLLTTRLHLRRNRKCNHPLIIFVYYDWILKILYRTFGFSHWSSSTNSISFIRLAKGRISLIA